MNRVTWNCLGESRRRRLLAAGCALILAGLVGCAEPADTSGPGDGFAGLGTEIFEGGFHQPQRGDRIDLPDDWGPHPQHRIEWWYLTANLQTSEGEPLGLQWTQFRQGLTARAPQDMPPAASLWPMESAWMAHGAVSFREQHWFSERFARGDIGQAGAQASPLRVWLDHWQLEETAPGRWRLQASGDGWRYRLWLEPQRPPVRHGDQGFSAKSHDGQGSMYFSLTDIAVSGRVWLNDTSHRVHGTGWLDREWSSQFLRSEQRGWDWFALRLDSGHRLMAFRVGEGSRAYRAGTWIEPSGQTLSLGPDDLQLTAADHRDSALGRVPTTWEIRIPQRSVSLEVKAVAGDYWNRGAFPYWESPVTVRGSHQGQGYLEMTGYDRR